MSALAQWWTIAAFGVAVVVGIVWVNFMDWQQRERHKERIHQLTVQALEEARSEVFSLRLRNRRLQALVRSHKARDDVRKMINNLERAAARK